MDIRYGTGELGCLRIDFDDFRLCFRSPSGHQRRRIYLAGGSNHEHHVRAPRRLLGSRVGLRRDSFSEENEIRLVYAAAGTPRRQFLQQGPRSLDASAACQARKKPRIAMELHDVPAAGKVVKVVDVLGDQGLQEAAALPVGQRLVRPVRFRYPEIVVEDLTDHGPGLFRVRNEIIELQSAGVVFTPEPAGTAEGRDAALNGDARAGKGGEVACATNEGGGLPDGIRNASV